MRITLALAIGGALIASAATAAPTAADAEAARAKMQAADANKDGKWSKDEWVAAGHKGIHFGMVDANKDGFVDQPEIKAGMEMMRKRCRDPVLLMPA